MGIIKFTTSELEQVIDGRLNNFHQDIVDSKQTEPASNNIIAYTPVRWANDGGNSNETTAPTYMTDRWDTATNVMRFTSEPEHPVYVSDFGFTFLPKNSGQTGSMTITAYINDSTTPKLILTSTKSYKGILAVDSLLMSFYLGDSAGYDLKNDGVYFEIEFDQDGKLWGQTQVMYRT